MVAAENRKRRAKRVRVRVREVPAPPIDPKKLVLDEILREARRKAEQYIDDATAREDGD
jgi:hypothetical protein